MAPLLTPGRCLLTFSALLQTVGSFYADWSRTHVFNPRWPPHAKFHNGQTMSLAALLSTLTLYYTFRRPTSTSTSNSIPSSPLQKRQQKRQDITFATLTGSLYWVSAFTAVLYPGSKAVDPEFGSGRFPQAPVFGVGLLAAVVGGWLEVRRLR